jgi:hypothetical protein
MDNILNKIGNALRASILWLFLAIGLYVVGLWIYDHYKISEYKKEVKTECVVLDKVVTVEGSRKHLISCFNFVLKDKKERKFDILVGVTDYSQIEIGDTIYLNLRESQIEHNSRLDGIDFLGVIVFGLSIFILIISIIVFYDKITE